ncbi:hypothetical protein LTT85_31700 [Nocardia asteroides]|nr:hypothetical protein [Nocardia asteroides]UGT55102.1 hypothetical protein LTT85_31700 [Nocardia asteroides]
MKRRRMRQCSKPASDSSAAEIPRFHGQRGLLRDRRNQHRGDDVDHRETDHRRITGRRARTTGEFDDRVQHSREAAMDSGSPGRQQRIGHPSPPPQTAADIIGPQDLDRWPWPIDEVGVYLEEVGATDIIGQAFSEWFHQRERELPGTRRFPTALEHLVSASLDPEVMLVDDRLQQTVTTAEVMLQRDNVAGARFTGYLAQTHVVDATFGEQARSGCDEAVARAVLSRRHPLLTFVSLVCTHTHGIPLPGESTALYRLEQGSPETQPGGYASRGDVTEG